MLCTLTVSNLYAKYSPVFSPESWGTAKRTTKYSKLPLSHQILLQLHIHRLLPYNVVISMLMESVESLYVTKQ